MSFFAEIKRRNVFRVGIAYLASAWLLFEVLSTIFNVIGSPDWLLQSILALLAVGFPVVLLFSWAYEITPHGLRKTQEVDRSGSISQSTGKRLNQLTIGLIVVAVGVLVADRLWLSPKIVDENRLAAASPDQPAVSDSSANVPESIAVLPFVDMSPAKDQQYLSDGLTEELINLLARASDLRVAARTSTFVFKESPASIAEIADMLGVTHILEGSVRKSGDRLRITAQLIDAGNGFQLWSESWDKTLTDVFQIQNEIAEAVTSSLHSSLSPEAAIQRSIDPDAYELYLQAKTLSELRTSDGFEESADLLIRALTIEPEFADAWLAWGNLQLNKAGQVFGDPAESYLRAIAFFERTLSIDPLVVDARTGLAWAMMYWQWDFQNAGRQIMRSYDTAPNNASVLNTYAVWMQAFGRLEESRALLRSAIEADPLSVSPRVNLAISCIDDGCFEVAEDQLRQIRKLSPESDWAKIIAGWIALRRGNPEAAKQEFVNVEGSHRDWALSVTYYALGRQEEAEAALARLVEESPIPVNYEVASAYAYQGRIDEAFEALYRAVAAREGSIVEMRKLWLFEPLRDDPRWQELIERLGLDDDSFPELES